MFDKNEVSKQNLYYANLKREQRLKEQQDEIERERIANEKLRYQIEQDKMNQLEKKNKIKQNQYEDYNNYLRQKFSTPPQYREKLNIKLGGEQRNIKKKDYNEEMENLCINPTSQKNVYPTTPVINYSEMGRNYQKGYSHGYNIITGEVYNMNNNQNNLNKNMNFNDNNKGNDNNLINKKEYPNNYNINISPEEYEEFLRFKEMKRQKELEQFQREKYANYMNNFNENEMRQRESENYENENQDQRELYSNGGQYLNEIQNPDLQKQQFFNNQIPEKRNIDYENSQINRYYGQKVKENFHYEKDKMPPSSREENENNYKQNKFYQEYQKEFLQNQERAKGNYNDNYERNYPSNYYQRDDVNAQIPPQNYNMEENENINKKEEPFYPQSNLNRENNDYENQRQFEKRDFGNIPYEFQQRGINNIPSDYEKEMMMRQKYNDEIEFRNKISFQDNQQMIQNEPNENKQMPPQGLDEKDIEREKYRQFLLNKANEIKDQNAPEENLNYKNNILNKEQEQNYPNERNYNQQMMDYQQGKLQNDNYYQNINQNSERDYYNNGNEPIQYNNFMPKNDYQNQYQREREEQESNGQEPHFLTYQQQMERIKRQEQEQDLPQNDKISNNPNENYANKNAKEIINEFNENKRKNMYSEDHIFHVRQTPQAPPKYNDEPLTDKEKRQIQRDYAKFLDWQINEKNKRNSKTPFNQKYNPILDNNNVIDNKFDEGHNPYQQMREKNNAMNDIPPNPYSNKNYDINSKSNLGSNPITNPSNNYNFPQNK